MKIIGVIPVRYDSTRLPAKALADILGKPMIQWVWEAAKGAKKLDQVVIATDDKRIKEAAETFGGKVMMTSRDCKSGTDRLREVMERLPADIYINIQGDEPLVLSTDLDNLVNVMLEKSGRQAATLYAPLSAEEAANPNVVKVVHDHEGKALYFSRSLIPFPRDESAAEYLGHLGIYAYRAEVLSVFSSLPFSSLEKTESLEQLRLIQAGIPIYLTQARRMTRGVDTQEDLDAVRTILSGERYKSKKRTNFGNIRLIITDVDGVLTDGGLYYDSNGEFMKRFCARDGLGMVVARNAGLRIAILSGRDSPALRARIKELGIDLFECGNLAKAEACERLIKEAGVSPEHTLFLGDDLPDKEAFKHCAIGVAPADAAESVLNAADWVTRSKGGEGVLREVIDRIMEARRGAQLD